MVPISMGRQMKTNRCLRPLVGAKAESKRRNLPRVVERGREGVEQ